MSPLPACSVTVLCTSSIRDMEPRQIYTVRVSDLSDRAYWLMPFTILGLFPTIFISLPSIIRAKNFRASFLNASNVSFIFSILSAGNSSVFFCFVALISPVLEFIFIKQVIIIFPCPFVKFPFVLQSQHFPEFFNAQFTVFSLGITLAFCKEKASVFSRSRDRNATSVPAMCDCGW